MAISHLIKQPPRGAVSAGVVKKNATLGATIERVWEESPENNVAD